MSSRIFLSLFIAAVATATSAQAAPTLFDDFNYPVGPLDGQNGGTGWAGAWNAIPEYRVASGSLSYTGLQQSGNRAQFVPSNLAGTNSLRTFSSAGSNGSTFWLSFLMSMDGTIAQNTADFRINGLNGNLSIGRELGDQANWSIEDSASGTPYTQSSVAIVPGKAIFVAIRIDQNADPSANDLITVYFNPDPAAVPSDNPGVVGMVIADLRFGTVNVPMALDGSAFPDPTTTGFVANFDPIRGGATYFDVAPAALTLATPEPSTWLFMTAGLAVIALTARRRPCYATSQTD